MTDKQFSQAFIEIQKINKVGNNNPQFGIMKSASTIAKLIKLVYV